MSASLRPSNTLLKLATGWWGVFVCAGAGIAYSFGWLPDPNKVKDVPEPPSINPVSDTIAEYERRVKKQKEQAEMETLANQLGLNTK